MNCMAWTRNTGLIVILPIPKLHVARACLTTTKTNVVDPGCMHELTNRPQESILSHFFGFCGEGFWARIYVYIRHLLSHAPSDRLHSRHRVGLGPFATIPLGSDNPISHMCTS